MAPTRVTRMDAESYLKRQGWRGSGHSLDKTDRGIKKPLLIAHKQDQMGLGTKKAAHKTDDQWWMRAFDESLRNIGTGKESTLAQVRKQGINRGGLYGFFVQGETLVSTILSPEESTMNSATASATGSETATSRATTPPTSVDSAAESKSKSKKRKLSAEDDAAKAELKRQKKEKKEKKEKKKDMAKTASSSDGESKSRKRKRDEPAPAAVVDTKAEDEAASNATKVLTRINRTVMKELKKLQKLENLSRPDSMAKEKEIKKGMVADAIVKGELPNPQAYTRDQVLEKYDEIMQDIRGIQDASRKRRDDAKQAAKDAKEGKQQPQPEEEPQIEQNPDVVAKISKLSDLEKKQYEERAKAKGQTLEQYVIRRIEKKGSYKKTLEVEKKEVRVKSKKSKAVAVSA